MTTGPGKMLALHMVDPGSIPGTPEGPLQVQLGVIPKMQSQKPWAPPRIAPPNKSITTYNYKCTYVLTGGLIMCGLSPLPVTQGVVLRSQHVPMFLLPHCGEPCWGAVRWILTELHCSSTKTSWCSQFSRCLPSHVSEPYPAYFRKCGMWFAKRARSQLATPPKCVGCIFSNPFVPAYFYLLNLSMAVH